MKNIRNLIFVCFSFSALVKSKPIEIFSNFDKTFTIGASKNVQVSPRFLSSRFSYHTSDNAAVQSLEDENTGYSAFLNNIEITPHDRSPDIKISNYAVSNKNALYSDGNEVTWNLKKRSGTIREHHNTPDNPAASLEREHKDNVEGNKKSSPIVSHKRGNSFVKSTYDTGEANKNLETTRYHVTTSVGRKSSNVDEKRMNSKIKQYSAGSAENGNSQVDVNLKSNSDVITKDPIAGFTITLSNFSQEESRSKMTTHKRVARSLEHVVNAPKDSNKIDQIGKTKPLITKLNRAAAHSSEKVSGTFPPIQTESITAEKNASSLSEGYRSIAQEISWRDNTSTTSATHGLETEIVTSGLVTTDTDVSNSSATSIASQKETQSSFPESAITEFDTAQSPIFTPESPSPTDPNEITNPVSEMVTEEISSESAVTDPVSVTSTNQITMTSSKTAVQTSSSQRPTVTNTDPYTSSTNKLETTVTNTQSPVSETFDTTRTTEDRTTPSSSSHATEAAPVTSETPTTGFETSVSTLESSTETPSTSFQETTPEVNESSTPPTEGTQICQMSDEEADSYVDRIIERMIPRIPEPISLPNRSGRFHLHDGSLHGLSTIYRTAQSRIYCENDLIYFKVPAGARNLQAFYDWKIRALFRTFEGTVLVGVRDFETQALYSARNITGNSEFSEVRVKSFKVVRMSGLQVEFTGFGPLNRIASGSIRMLMSTFKRSLSRAMEKPIRDAINNELKKYDQRNQFK